MILEHIAHNLIEVEGEDGIPPVVNVAGMSQVPSFRAVLLHPLTLVPLTHAPCGISCSKGGSLSFRCDADPVSTASSIACMTG